MGNNAANPCPLAGCTADIRPPHIGEVSARFLASCAGGYAIWLTYGLRTGSLPLIVADTVGVFCGGLTLAVALSLRGSLIRPATWNSHQHDVNRTKTRSPRSAV